jgi:hypothetical protein
MGAQGKYEAAQHGEPNTLLCMPESVKNFMRTSKLVGCKGRGQLGKRGEWRAFTTLQKQRSHDIHLGGQPRFIKTQCAGK